MSEPTPFPFDRARKSTGGAPARSATVESDLDEGNPCTDSLRALLLERRGLIERYTSSDGSVWEVESKIARRLAQLSGLSEDGAEPAKA